MTDYTDYKLHNWIDIKKLNWNYLCFENPICFDLLKANPESIKLLEKKSR